MSNTPQRQDNPEELWKMIEERDKRIAELHKYKQFFEMLRLSNTPIQENS